MTKNRQTKDSFVFRISWQEVLMDYPPEVRLEVYDAIIAYAASGTLTELKPLAKMAFSFIKRDLDIAAEKYQDVVTKKAEAGRKGMKSRWKKNNTDNKNNKCYSEITDVTPITNITDKCKVISDKCEEMDSSTQKEEVKEENPEPEFPPYEPSPTLEECYNELITSEGWAEQFIMQKRRLGINLTQRELRAQLEIFFGELKCRGTPPRDVQATKEHFSNWINTTYEKKQKNERNFNTRTGYTSHQDATEYAVQQFVLERQARSESMAATLERPF